MKLGFLCCVSPETICRSLFIQAPGVLKKELIDHLRSMRHASILIAKNMRSSPVFSFNQSMAFRCSSVMSLKIQITILASCPAAFLMTFPRWS